nr:MAG TPA: Protein of unknown function (DUF551) [Caudoviricetes sp.]
MKNTEWNKLTTRPLNNEEKECYGNRFDFMWEGNQPEIGEEVLVYTLRSKEVYTDIWTDDFNFGLGFENTEEKVIYWMSLPEPPKIKEKKDE